MAFVENIIDNDKNIDVILQMKRRNGARNTKANKMAAITIQRHFRGYYTRLYISKLNLAAITIQKHWRGYMTRRYFNGLLIKTFVNKSIDYYNKTATTIQKHFKGYYVRKYHLDVKKIRKWIKEILKKNDAMSIVMKDYKQSMCTELEKINKEKMKCKVTEIVCKHHSLLRTKSIPGVFSIKENIYNDTEFEKLIRDLYVQINKKNF